MSTIVILMIVSSCFEVFALRNLQNASFLIVRFSFFIYFKTFEITFILFSLKIPQLFYTITINNIVRLRCIIKYNLL